MNNPFLHYVADFEKEAEDFLEKYGFSDAIENPQRIPIRDIATRLMMLDIVETESLSPNESVQGAIAFSAGIIDVYDWASNEYIGYEVSQPTIFVDADIENIGRANNTLAHECYHWWRHRNYFTFSRTHESRSEFGIRCERVGAKDEADSGQKSAISIMEWQARTIAPMILMPRTATKKKVEALYARFQCKREDRYRYTEQVIISLASFFEVSKQAAAIRMVRLGYDEASEYAGGDSQPSVGRSKNHNSTSNAKRHQRPISIADAFKLYSESEYLRSLIDTGAFCYADGYFVINNDRYLSTAAGCALTEYARTHLAECTLDFSVRLIAEQVLIHDASSHLMYRSDTVFKEKSSFEPNTQNTELYNKARDFENKFKRSLSSNKTANEQLWEYMQEQHWNSSIFVSRTLLEAINYTRVQRRNHKFTLKPLVAMGVGLSLDAAEMKNILSLAGLSFAPTSRDDLAYQYLFSGMYGRSIEECNAFLETVNVPILGTIQRK